MIPNLKGKKTYIMASLIALLAVAHSMGYIEETAYQSILALLGAGAISTLAAKINRTNGV